MIKRPYISICQQLWSQNSPSNNHFNIRCLLWFLVVVLVLFSFALLGYSFLFVLIVFSYSFLLFHVILFGYFILFLCLHYSITFYHFHRFHALCYFNYSTYFWLYVYLVLFFALCWKWILKECGIVMNCMYVYTLKSCSFSISLIG